MTVLTKRNFMIAGSTTIVVAGAALAVRRGVLERLAGFEELPPTPIFAEDGLAIRGTDPVAYFREGRPVVGDAAFEADWKGTRWRFASARNRDDFLATPERFAPQYGGFCAWAVAARGKLYSTQPENWSVVDGKLYLNFNDDIQRKWEADIDGFITRADKRWPEIVRSLA
jgi:YHS domain-containing protein